MLASLSARQTQEIALAIGAIAGLVFAYGAFSVLGRRRHHRTSEGSHRIERISYLIAALLLTLSFLLSLVAVRTKTSQPTAPAPGVSSSP